MDSRPFFLFGDAFSNASVAALSALAMHWLFSPDWPMFPAMLLGMILGMIIANVCCLFVLMRFFGAMEIMLPTMVTGMLVGMVIAMSRTMTTLSLLDHLTLALLIGLACTAAIWALDTSLSGEQLRSVPKHRRNDAA